MTRLEAATGQRPRPKPPPTTRAQCSKMRTVKTHKTAPSTQGTRLRHAPNGATHEGERPTGAIVESGVRGAASSIIARPDRRKSLATFAGRGDRQARTVERFVERLETALALGSRQADPSPSKVPTTIHPRAVQDFVASLRERGLDGSASFLSRIRCPSFPSSPADGMRYVETRLAAALTDLSDRGGRLPCRMRLHHEIVIIRRGGPRRS